MGLCDVNNWSRLIFFTWNQLKTTFCNKSFLVTPNLQFFSILDIQYTYIALCMHCGPIMIALDIMGLQCVQNTTTNVNNAEQYC